MIAGHCSWNGKWGVPCANTLSLYYSGLVVVKIGILLVSTSGEAGDGQERQRRAHSWDHLENSLRNWATLFFFFYSPLPDLCSIARPGYHLTSGGSADGRSTHRGGQGWKEKVGQRARCILAMRGEARGSLFMFQNSMEYRTGNANSYPRVYWGQIRRKWLPSK